MNKKVEYLQYIAFAMAMIGIPLDSRNRDSIGLYLIILGCSLMLFTVILKYRNKKK